MSSGDHCPCSLLNLSFLLFVYLLADGSAPVLFILQIKSSSTRGTYYSEVLLLLFFGILFKSKTNFPALVVLTSVFFLSHIDSLPVLCFLTVIVLFLLWDRSTHFYFDLLGYCLFFLRGLE